MSEFMASLIKHIGYILQPLQRSLAHPERFSRLLRRHGWDTSPADILAVMDEIRSIFSYDQLNSTLDSLSQLLISDTQFVWEDVKDILITLKDVIVSIKEISTPIAAGGTPFDDTNFWKEFSAELIDELIIDYIASSTLSLFLGLRLLGIIKVEPRIMDGVAGRLSYLKRSIEWHRFNDQPQLFKDTYGWDAFNRSYLDYIIQIMLLLKDVGFYYRLDEPDPDLIAKYYGSNPVPSDVKQLNIPLIRSKEEVPPVDISFLVLPIPDESQTGNPVGFVIGATLKGILDQFKLGNWTVDISGFLGTEKKVLIEVRPNNIGLDLYGHNPSEINASISYKKEDYSTPEFIMGSRDATRIEIERFEGDFGVKGSIATPEFEIALGIPPKGGKLVIVRGDGDGFIQKILPEDPITINFDIMLGYSRRKGFYISGGAGFEYTFQINKSFGPIFINTVDLKLDLSAGKIVLITAVTGGVEVGPVSAIVHGIGLKTIIELGKPGILGKADLSLGFKPPTMIGFGINTSTAKGWGMLEIDPPNYAGGFGLNIVDKFAVAAYVLIATELPNGEPGFSLFTSFIGEFMPGIQLGYGFVLYGFGGLFGLNRRICEEALRVGIKNGEATKIFNTNPGIDTGNFLESIRSFFPVCDGHYVFGPMVKIFWGGAKKVIEFSGGVFVEFGGPIRIAILGNIHAALPKEESPVIVLNVDILGFIDLGKKTLAIDGSIFNSKLLKKYKLSGEFALRASWGTPSFAVSFGGFHPQARHIPPNFPKLKRMKISLGKKNPRISLSCYLALTSNTFQTGAKLDIHYKVSSFVVTADLGFDALIIFNPFSFEVDIDGRAKIKKGGSTLFSIDLGLDLTGPNPYCVKGYGVIKICKIKTKVRFNKTFGEKVSESRPIVSPADLLREELQMAQPILELPAWASKGVVLTEDAEDYLSPLGRVVWTQTRVPLNTNLDLCGAGKPPNEQKKIKLEVYRVTSTGNTDLNDLLTDPPTEFFAPGQWKTYNSDAKRLSAPPFELWTSGVAYEGGGRVPDLDSWQLRENEYETSLVNPPEVSAEVEFVRMDQVPRFTIAHLPSTRARLASKIWAMQAGKNYYKPARNRTDKSSPIFVQVKEPSFTVTTHEADGERFERVEVAGNPASDMTYHEALDLARENGENDVVIRNSAFAKSLQTGG